MTPGVRRAPDLSPAELIDRARQQGRAVLGLNTTGERTKAAFLATAGRALGAGDDFGANLDALYDALRDLDDAVVLLWSGWAELAQAEPVTFDVLVELFEDRAAEAGLSVVLVGPGPAGRVPLLD